MSRTASQIRAEIRDRLITRQARRGLVAHIQPLHKSLRDRNRSPAGTGSAQRTQGEVARKGGQTPSGLKVSLRLSALSTGFVGLQVLATPNGPFLQGLPHSDVSSAAGVRSCSRIRKTGSGVTKSEAGQAESRGLILVTFDVAMALLAVTVGALLIWAFRAIWALLAVDSAPYKSSDRKKRD